MLFIKLWLPTLFQHIMRQKIFNKKNFRILQYWNKDLFWLSGTKEPLDSNIRGGCYWCRTYILIFKICLLYLQQASAQRKLLGKWTFTDICVGFCEPGQRSFSTCRCLGRQSFIGKRSPWFLHAGLWFRREKLWYTSQLQASSTGFVKWKNDSFLCLVSIFLLYQVITL